MKDLADIKTYLKSFNILSEKDLYEFIARCKRKAIGKGDFLIQNTVCKEVAFVISGVFRSYYISGQGEEITYCISFPGSFIGAYSSFITNRGTTENIQALSPCELLIISKKDLEELQAASIGWVHFLKRMAEEQYVALEKRVFQLQVDSARDRYVELLTYHPEYVTHISLRYLASYLGITQRHLSRIRKELA